MLWQVATQMSVLYSLVKKIYYKCIRNIIKNFQSPMVSMRTPSADFEIGVKPRSNKPKLFNSIVWNNMVAFYCFYYEVCSWCWGPCGCGGRCCAVWMVTSTWRFPFLRHSKLTLKKNLNWTFECLVVTSICFVFESIASDPSFTELLGMWSAFPLSFEMDYIFGPNIRKKGHCK